MKRNLYAALACTAGLLAGGPALAAAGSNATSGQNGSTRQQVVQSLPVMPASQIVGRALVDPQGHDAGQIDSLVLDTHTGAVDYVLVGSRDNFNLNNQLAALPWSVLQGLGDNGAVQVNVSAQKVANGPTINRSELDALNQVGTRNRVYGYYGVTSPYAGGPYPGYGAPYGVPYVRTFGYAGPAGVPGSGMAYNKWTTTGNNSANNNSANNNAARNNNGGQLSVASNGVVTALGSSANVSPQALRSTSVHTRNGDFVGNIDQVMIDTAHGMVAFVLIKRGGFLGLNPTWYAAPVEAMVWSPSQENYLLTVTSQQMNRVPSIPANNGNLTNSVNAGALAQLYSDYDVRPYWQTTASNS